MRDLARPWGFAAIAWVAGMIIASLVIGLFSSLPDLESQLDKGLWVGVPSLVIFIVIAAVGAVAHRGPQRAKRARHAAAALAVPCVGILLTLLLSLAADTKGIAILARLAGSVIGMLVGWLLADRLHNEDAQPARSAYF